MPSCKGKTLKGGSCKKKVSNKRCKYCYSHQGGVTKLNAKATAFVPGKKPSVKRSSVTRSRRSSVKGPVKVFRSSVKLPKPPVKKRKYIPPHLRNKKSLPKKSPKKSPKKKFVPPHLRPGAKLSRFAKYSPPKGLCVNYQHACKNTKYGNVYNNKCHPRNYIDFNVGLKNQAEKCANLRKQNRKCRIASGLDATPRHNHAISQTENNSYNNKHSN